MKKLINGRLMGVLALSAVALLATSCGKQSAPGSAEDDVKTEKVIWWNNYQAPTTGTEEDNRKSSTYREYYYALDLISEFQKEHPNITVQQVYKGSYSKIKEAVDAALSSGDTPNIATCYGDHVAAYNEAGATLDMTTFIDDNNIGFGKKTIVKDGEATYVEDSKSTKSDFDPNYLSIEKDMYNGAYLSMPYSKSAETLVVNKTVFDTTGTGSCGTTTAKYTAPTPAAAKSAYSVPKTWGELISTAKQMKADFPSLFGDSVQKDEDGYFKAIPFCWDSGENMFISMCENLGIKYTDGKGGSLVNRVLFNNDAAKKMVVQLKKWNNEGLICTQNQLPITDVANNYHDYSSNKVVAGTIFMCMSSTAGARYFALDGGFEASMNATPIIDHASFSGVSGTDLKASKVISQGPSLTFFNKKDAGEVRASWEFYKYLTSTDNSASLAKNTSYFPVRASSYETQTIKDITNAPSVTAASVYAEKNAYYSGSVLKLNKTYSQDNRYFLSPVFEESSATRTAVGTLLTTVFDGKASTDAEIETLVNNAFKTAYEAVAK